MERLLLAATTVKIGKIALDDAEAYKVKSAYYEEVLDPMAAAFLANVKSESMRAVSVAALVVLNLLRSLVVYGLIFLLVGVMAFHVSKELASVTAFLRIGMVGSVWIVGSTTTINSIVLGLSALLLLLAWLNAGWVVLITLWEIVRRAARLLISWFAPVYPTSLFAPLRAIFRSVYYIMVRARERHRD